MRIKLNIIFFCILGTAIILYLSGLNPLKHVSKTTPSVDQFIDDTGIHNTTVEYVTNPIRSDGFGAQFQTIIYSLIFAEFNNFKFIYTPFTSMEHNYNNDTEYLHKKEELINFIYNFEAIKDKNNVTQLKFTQIKDFFEKNIKMVADSDSLKKIKAVFRNNKSKKFFNNDKFNIAVHIRRPNHHDSRLEGSDVPDQVFIRIIDYLKTTFSKKNYLIHVYSQGDLAKLKSNADNRIIFHLDESVEDTFTGMVLADVLVMSPSSLSYAAGLLSEGIVYYIPFWHAPLPAWRILNIDNNGVAIVEKSRSYQYPMHAGY